MPQYLIERNIPGAGAMTDQEWQQAAAQSNTTLRDLGGEARWLHSYVTTVKLYCVYDAPDQDIILEHGRAGGFPTDVIAKVIRMVDPTTGDSGRRTRDV